MAINDALIVNIN